MSEPISNRYDFVILFDVENGNPNGDPDAGNMPRVDPETGFGLVTDVCLKRKIRNYVETVKEDSEGYRIYIKDQVPLQRSDAEALTYLGVDKDLKSAKKDDPLLDGKIRDFMCRNFYDIRTFGAVMTTFVKGALNCGQVRGPVQIGFARSVDPILPQEITITRVAITTESDAANKDTEMGRKYIVPYGLYRAEGFVSANLARKVTGFSQEDLQQIKQLLPTLSGVLLPGQEMPVVIGGCPTLQLTFADGSQSQLYLDVSDEIDSAVDREGPLPAPCYAVEEEQLAPLRDIILSYPLPEPSQS